MARIVSAVGLWYWKRWSVYLYIVVTFGSMIIDFIVLKSRLVTFYALVPLLILAYVLQGQRKMQLLE